MKVMFRGIAMLCVLQLLFFTGTAHSQERDSATVGNHKILYGLHAGFTLNTVDLYSTQGGVAQALEEGNRTIYAPGFRFAVIGEIPLNRNISLRAMPGVSLFKSNWEPGNVSVPTSPSTDYKVESVCGELPVDVKFIAIRWGNLEPYLVSGLSYSFDFASLRNDSDAGSVQPLNAHDLRFSFGWGVDWYTRYLKIGFEFKAGYGLLPPHTSGGDHTNPFYFHNSNSFYIGLNIEA
jgi:hypothetical protein